MSSSSAAIDLVMPGVDIWSTWTDGQWVQLSGTSQAAPHAAGLAAIYIAEHGRDVNGDGSVDALDVYAIRQALIDSGMTQGTGMRMVDQYAGTEPDAHPENLGWAGPVGDLTDIAVVAVSAPTAVVQGESLGVDVTVTNVGNQDVTSPIPVTLTDVTDGMAIGNQTVSGLAVGDSTTLTFIWDTTSASLGSHTLTATQSFTDDHGDNDTNSSWSVWKKL